MNFPKQQLDAPSDQDIECLECGIRLGEDEVIDLGGDTLCEFCAEEHLDDDDLAAQPNSVEEPLQPFRSWHYH